MFEEYNNMKVEPVKHELYFTINNAWTPSRTINQDWELCFLIHNEHSKVKLEKKKKINIRTESQSQL